MFGTKEWPAIRQTEYWGSPGLALPGLGESDYPPSTKALQLSRHHPALSQKYKVAFLKTKGWCTFSAIDRRPWTQTEHAPRSALNTVTVTTFTESSWRTTRAPWTAKGQDPQAQTPWWALPSSTIQRAGMPFDKTDKEPATCHPIRAQERRVFYMTKINSLQDHVKLSFKDHPTRPLFFSSTRSARVNGIQAEVWWGLRHRNQAHISLPDWSRSVMLAHVSYYLQDMGGTPSGNHNPFMRRRRTAKTLVKSKSSFFTLSSYTASHRRSWHRPSEGHVSCAIQVDRFIQSAARLFSELPIGSDLEARPDSGV